MIKSWNKFFESLTIPTLKIDELIQGIGSAGKSHKNILSMYFNTYENYIDIDDELKHTFKVNDLTGDIMNNGRVQFFAMIFGKDEIDRVIKNNIINISMNEFYSNLPNNINIFGIDIKPISFINKDDLKFTFGNILTIDELKKIITITSGYNYVGEKDGYFIWKKM